MSEKITVNINIRRNAIPICWITIRVLIVRGLLITPSIRCKNIWPPSRPGMGKIFKKAKLTLSKAIKVKNGIKPASAVWPASCAIIIGPPKSLTDAEPENSMPILEIIKSKLDRVLSNPMDRDSNSVDFS